MTGAIRSAADLSRRAARLRAVAPKLRAKGAGEAAQVFLSRDAVMPAALPLSDRAARRLCDRLVELGVVRELTGRIRSVFTESEMAKDRSDSELDRDLEDLPPELRWREWMSRVEAVIFASASPVSRKT